MLEYIGLQGKRSFSFQKVKINRTFFVNFSLNGLVFIPKSLIYSVATFLFFPV